MDRQGYSIDNTTSEIAMLKKIIENIVFNNVNSSFLAKVDSVIENKVNVVSISQIEFNDELQDPLVIPNVLVGFPFTQSYYAMNEIKPDDVGVCIVLNNDITNYKKDGVVAGSAASDRRFNVNDAIFIPLSMYKQLNIEPGFIIGATDRQSIIKLLDNDDINSLNMLVKNDDGNIDLLMDNTNSMAQLEVKNSDGSMVLLLDNANNAISLTSDKGEKVDITAEEATFTIKGKEMNLTMSGKVVIKCDKIDIDGGGGALEAVVLGDSFKKYFDTHVHTGNMGAPTSPPVAPMPANTLSTTNKTT